MSLVYAGMPITTPHRVAICYTQYFHISESSELIAVLATYQAQNLILAARIPGQQKVVVTVQNKYERQGRGAFLCEENCWIQTVK